MNLTQFVATWGKTTLTEKAGAQSHFLDLCDMLGKPKPAEADPSGDWYAFEKGVAKTGGGAGFADVWMRGRFAWEYKGRKKNLADAYQQLLQYREDLENPPLLVVCDLNRFEVHTNFTGTVKRVFAFDLADLGVNAPTPTCALPPLDVLRALFEDPNRLRPERTTAQVTEAAAGEFGKIALSLGTRGAEPHEAARFLIRLLFCLFAEDIGLLPPRLFTRLVENTKGKPADFTALVRQLFGAMATGGWFGSDRIAQFNGGLFADDTVLDLTPGDLAALANAAKLDWASIEPSIFGTLFERGLDPSKRSQLGAHYTSREDILLIVEPVLMAPLRRRWAEVQEQARAHLARRPAWTTIPGHIASPSERAAVTRFDAELSRLLQGFSEELAGVRVLDPACGSGNFLYVALKQLLDLEKAVIAFATACGLSGFAPRVGPEQMHGIELNEYAHELAPVTVWIGYIQWLRDNGFGKPDEPILRPFETVVHRDAILAEGADGQPAEPAWPEADVIIGNPPFLGGKRLRAELGDGFVDRLFALYDGRVPREADLVCYWFERARALVAAGKVRRAGLLATNSIRGGANRRVLEQIKETGDIFMAWSDRPWILEGAAVRVSMVGFDNGVEKERTLDGLPAESISPNLSGAVDLTASRRLPENANLAFMGVTPAGSFDVPGDMARAWLGLKGNPNGRPNSDVLRPYYNGNDVTRRPRDVWTVDFGVSMTEDAAALYEQPFEYVREHVKPERQVSRTTRTEWWLHERPRPELRKAIAPLKRYIGTSMVAKHRIFSWIPSEVLPANLLIVVTREDDYFIGVLHSKPHELWALSMCSWLGVGNDPRYTPTTTFETFPFPWPPGEEPKDDTRVQAIAEAARDLVEKRDNWLNPPGMPEAELRKRTLTNLYNERPTWLNNAHKKLDAAVCAAYGWPATLTDEEILERLLALNRLRSEGDSPAR